VIGLWEEAGINREQICGKNKNVESQQLKNKIFFGAAKFYYVSPAHKFWGEDDSIFTFDAKSDICRYAQTPKFKFIKMQQTQNKYHQENGRCMCRFLWLLCRSMH
jgi:hypothetical protein